MCQFIYTIGPYKEYIICKGLVMVRGNMFVLTGMHKYVVIREYQFGTHSYAFHLMVILTIKLNTIVFQDYSE